MSVKKNKSIYKFLIKIRKTYKNYPRSFIIGMSVIIGLITGLLAILLKNGVFYMRQLLHNETEFTLYNYLLLIFPIIGIALTIMFLKYVILFIAFFSSAVCSCSNCFIIL